MIEPCCDAPCAQFKPTSVHRKLTRKSCDRKRKTGTSVQEANVHKRIKQKNKKTRSNIAIPDPESKKTVSNLKHHYIKDPENPSKVQHDPNLRRNLTIMCPIQLYLLCIKHPRIDKKVFSVHYAWHTSGEFVISSNA